MKTQTVLDKFRPILKKALNQYVSEMMNDKIKSALSVNENHADGNSKTEEVAEMEENTSKIVTTNAEMEAFYAVKSMLVGVLDAPDVTYKDTESYFSICYKGMVTKWICRLFMNSAKKQLIIPGEGKTQQKFAFESIDDLFQYRDQLIESAKRFSL